MNVGSLIVKEGPKAIGKAVEVARVINAQRAVRAAAAAASRATKKEMLRNAERTDAASIDLMGASPANMGKTPERAATEAMYAARAAKAQATRKNNKINTAISDFAERYGAYVEKKRAAKQAFKTQEAVALIDREMQQVAADLPAHQRAELVDMLAYAKQQKAAEDAAAEFEKFYRKQMGDLSQLGVELRAEQAAVEEIRKHPWKAFGKQVSGGVGKTWDRTKKTADFIGGSPKRALASGTVATAGGVIGAKAVVNSREKAAKDKAENDHQVRQAAKQALSTMVDLYEDSGVVTRDNGARELSWLHETNSDRAIADMRKYIVGVQTKMNEHYKRGATVGAKDIDAVAQDVWAQIDEIGYATDAARWRNIKSAYENVYGASPMSDPTITSAQFRAVDQQIQNEAGGKGAK